MAFDGGPDGIGVVRMQPVAERIYRTRKLRGRIPQDFPETIRVKDDIRLQIPVPEAVGRACQGQKIALVTGAQCRFRLAVARPLYQQPDDQQGHADTEKSKDDDMPWV